MFYTKVSVIIIYYYYYLFVSDNKVHRTEQQSTA